MPKNKRAVMKPSPLSARLPMQVIAYLGTDGWMPEDQPHWADETHSLDEARSWADETYDWWLRTHMSPDDLDAFVVGVWREDTPGGVDEPTPFNALYLRGCWGKDEDE